MKNFTILIATFMAIITFSATSFAQVELIDNPDAGRSYGQFIEFNGKLYSKYKNASDVYQLAVLNDTEDGLTLIANPDASTNDNYSINLIVFNNKLYLSYKNESGIVQLAVLNDNGDGLTLIANPDAGYLYSSPLVVFNNKLYMAYANASDVRQLAVLNDNGDGLTLIVNPDVLNSYQGCLGSFVIFNSKLYFTYKSPLAKELAVLNETGDGITLITNPEGGQIEKKAIVNNKLYVTYSFTGTYRLGVLNTAGDVVSLIANPDAGALGSDGMMESTFSLFTAFNDKLYTHYTDESDVHQLAVLNAADDVLSLIANPDAGILGLDGFLGAMVSSTVFNSHLYLNYTDASSVHQLAVLNAAGDGLSLIPNPDAGTVGGDMDISFSVYNEKLYMNYTNTNYKQQLAELNTTGNALTLIDNPSVEGHISSLLIVFNNKLYGQYSETTQQLYKYHDGTTTSIEKELPNFAHIYSNAAVIYINLAKAEASTVKVFDLSGRMVKELTSSAAAIQINNLKAGTYIVKVSSQQGVNTEKVFVK